MNQQKKPENKSRFINKKPQIFLEDQPLNFSSRELPCLVTYKKGTGGSYFSLQLAAELLEKDYKLIFFCAFSEGRRKFLKLIGDSQRGRVALITNEQQIKEAHNYRVALVESGNEELLLKALSSLKGNANRVVFVKNMETLGKSTFQKLKKFPKVVFSGDLDKCLDKAGIAKRGYQTMIFFSRPKIFLPFKFPELKKFQGFLWNSKCTGKVEARFFEEVK